MFHVEHFMEEGQRKLDERSGLAFNRSSVTASFSWVCFLCQEWRATFIFYDLLFMQI